MKLLATSQLIEKKSKFLGFYFHCENETEIQEALAFLKAEHKKATHICWAGRMTTPFYERAVDDGEPGGTAGRPILSVLQKQDRKNVMVAIVRYFGGIKLGAGGLVRAYAKATAELLKEIDKK